jgi:hypothetical protein
MYEDEFEDFNSEEHDDFMPSEMDEHLELLKDKLARANYNAIVNQGVDPETTNNIDIIQKLIQETMQYFEDLEEYEKCAGLKKVLDTLEEHVHI